MKVQSAVCSFALVAAIFCASAQTATPVNVNPANWPNAFIHKNANGSVTIWSDLLTAAVLGATPELAHYANCISDRDEPYYLGIMNRHGHLDGAAHCPNKGIGLSADEEIIIDSDAMRACKEIGGELPSEQDFVDLGGDGAKMPNADEYVWTTTFAQDEWSNAEAVMLSPSKGIKHPWKYFLEEVGMGTTRCVSHQ